jgi:fructose-1,6-bisphosphatase I
VISNDIFVNALKFSTKLCIMASEENDEPIMIEQHQAGKYVIAFDPLDGSSVIDCNGSVGSIWGIWKQKEAGRIGISI